MKTYLLHPTATTLSYKTLLQSGFPKIEICVSPGLDMEYLQQQGYTTLARFAEGRGRNNEGELFGWNGNSSVGVEQFFENAYIVKNISTLLKEWNFYMDDKRKNRFVKILERKYKYPDGKCLDVMIDTDHKEFHPMVVSLILLFNEIKNADTINIRITDPLREYFLTDIFSFSGKEIKKSLNSDKTSNIYRIQIKEFVQLEDDDESNCLNYHLMTKGYKTCVLQKVQDVFLPQYGCLPPWFAQENPQIICSKSFNEKEWKNMSELIFTYLDSTFTEVRVFFLSFPSFYSSPSFYSLFSLLISSLSYVFILFFDFVGFFIFVFVFSLFLFLLVACIFCVFAAVFSHFFSLSSSLQYF